MSELFFAGNEKKEVILNAGYVRSKMPKTRHWQSNLLAIAIFGANFSAYLLTFAAIIFAPFWAIKIIAVALNGLFIGTLFVAGHDACHGSFAANKFLNHLLGRIAFLPSLITFSAWEVAHNQLHHGFTNLKPKDYPFVPLSKQEFDALPNWRKNLHRFYRTIFGVAFYYQIEVWWKHMIIPRKSDFERIKRTVFIFDISLVAAFLLFETVALFFIPQYIAAHFGLEVPSPLMLVLLTVILPFAVWSWLVAFVTLQHHTHPQVRWFDKKSEWDFFNSQVRASVRVELPRIVEILFNNVLEHTAHHVDSKIPLYNLRESQKSLEAAFTKDITVQGGSIMQLHRTLKICKLYDYDNHQWLDFDGNVTSKIEI